MLNLLRKKKVMKKILWGLAIIIIPAFVLWGAGSLSKRKFAFKYVGTIEGKKVPVEEFVKSLKNVQVGIILNYINQPEVMEKIQSDRKLTNRLAWENIILQRAATKNKITVSDKAVISFVMTHPLFSRGGTFDGKLYDYILKNNFGMTPRDFEESVRSFLVSMKYRTALVKNLDVTDKELFESYKNEFEKAAFYCVLIDKERFKKDSAVSDDEIAAFYEENKENFRAAEKVVVQYISFPHKEKGEKGDALLKLKRFYEILKSKPQNMEALAEDLNLTVKETAPFSLSLIHI